MFGQVLYIGARMFPGVNHTSGRYRILTKCLGSYIQFIMSSVSKEFIMASILKLTCLANLIDISLSKGFFE